MRHVLSTVIVVSAALAAADVFVGAQGTAVPPPWAYGFAVPPPPGTVRGGGGAGGRGGGARGAAPAAPVDETLRHLPGTTQAFTLAQLRDGANIADWYPMDHPPMPDVVQHGRMPDVRSCGLCHYPNGKGRPENAPASGQSAAYITQQLMDFKNDARVSADPRKGNTGIMTTIAKAMTDEEIKTTATYFSSIKWTGSWVTVKEADMVPKTRIAAGLFLNAEDGMSEPLGNRIIEIPERTENTEAFRDPRSGFIAYVPVGSLKKGEALVTTGGAGKTVQCAMCHGSDLKGLGPVPAIAGRSPSYLVRQMFDMQQGFRKGMWTDLMKGVVAKLNDDDMLQIAAYVAAQKP